MPCTRVRPDKTTKTRWDWSTAGNLKDGKPFVVKNAKGDVTYCDNSMKGDFVWADKVAAERRADDRFNDKSDHVGRAQLGDLGLELVGHAQTIGLQCLAQ